MRFASVLIGLLATLVFAQAPPTFEVASVRVVPADATPRGGIRGGPRTSDPGRITVTASTMKFILMKAYDLQYYQITGPTWLDEDRYEIVARVPEGTTRETAMTMLQSLVIERFALKLHTETRELPVYALRVGKNGHKLTTAEGEADDDAEAEFFGAPLPRGKDGFAEIVGHLRSGFVTSYFKDQARITMIRQPLKTFTDRLSNRMDRPVLDRTGLQGLFSFVVNYTAPTTMTNTMNDDVAGDSIFTAVKQQLGLQFEPTKGPVRFLVIESGMRVPVEN